MKIVSYSQGISSQRIGVVLTNGRILDIERACRFAQDAGVSIEIETLPESILPFLELGSSAFRSVQTLVQWAETTAATNEGCTVASETITLLSPVPRPTSMRDGYAFRQHVESARRNRGLEMIPEYDEIPIFYFTNHNAVSGPGNVDVQDMHLDQLDFELEVAIVIGKQGKNIKSENADDYIAGYTIMNDWSARALQMHEMKLNLGPAKGKDFSTTLGPWLVTRDELAQRKVETPNGEKYNLTMITRLNGSEVSRGNVIDMTWTFAQIIERASYGVTLYPGDVIGSGTCGTGCFLELNGSKVYTPPLWLKDGDVVECEIEMLGNLVNTVRRVGE